MLSLGDVEVDFIEYDLKSRGIVSEDLRDDLLDHICCIIESELSDKTKFHEYYEHILPRFFKKELSEIQTETDNLIRFKNFYTMKKILKISGMATVAFTLFGALFKTLHYPGAGFLIATGGFLFSFLFLPLLIIIKFRDKDSTADRYVFGFGFLLAMLMCIGLIFKLMHWPGATKLMLYSTVTFTFLYVPVYFFTRIKRPDVQFNTIVNSVLMIACGGIFYSLFDLRYSQQFSQNRMQDHVFMHQHSEQIMTANQRLLNIQVENTTANQLHILSEQLNAELEILANQVDQSGTAQLLDEQLNDLGQLVNQYNTNIAQLDSDELKLINTEIDKLNQIYPMLAMNAFARIQQQVALNETYFLTASISNKTSLH